MRLAAYMPTTFGQSLGQVPKLLLDYGPHARRALKDEGIDWTSLPTVLPAGAKVVESVEVLGRPLKYTIRMRWTQGRDLILMVRPGGYVVTAWTQHPDQDWNGQWRTK